MRTTIYYFTGTGNTLAVARSLAAELGDTELVPIASVIQQELIVASANAVGIAFPVYFLDIPGIVREFVQKLRISRTQYVFCIATCGERPGGAIFNLKSILEEKGALLSAGFSFVMPENFIGPVDLMGDAPYREGKYAAAQRQIPAVAAVVRERRQTVPEGNGSAILRIGGSIARTFAQTLYNIPGRLHATEKCTRCGTCERICPTHNITVGNDGIRWGSSCTRCYACIHWCPQGAVEIGGRTTGKPRYHHPDVTINDMLDQRGDA